MLLKNHGVFTIGKNAEAAVKAAVMTEDNARTVWLALQLGTPTRYRPRTWRSCTTVYECVWAVKPSPPSPLPQGERGYTDQRFRMEHE